MRQSLAPADTEQVMLLGKRHPTDFGGESSSGKLEDNILQVTSTCVFNPFSTGLAVP